MKRFIMIEDTITRDDMENGQAKECGRCPIARLVKRNLPTEMSDNCVVEVYRNRIEIRPRAYGAAPTWSTEERYAGASQSENVATFIDAFDEGDHRVVNRENGALVAMMDMEYNGLDNDPTIKLASVGDLIVLVLANVANDS